MGLSSTAPAMACISTIALCFFTASFLAQNGAESTPTFESASVKPAPADAPMAGLGWMIGLGHELPPHGLLRMTGPLPPLIIFAYNVQDEVEARAMRARLPAWARDEKFTIVARSLQDAPTMEQIRRMMRTLLEDRFALKAHRETHTGTVNLLVLAKPGILGPGLKQHDPSHACLQRGSAPLENASGNGAPPQVDCGLELQTPAGAMVRVNMTDVSLPEACTLLGGLGGVLGGRSMDIVTDATDLTGKWDISFEFLPDRTGPAAEGPTAADASGPSFSNALEKHLGLRLKKGTGQVEDLIVDQISPPNPD